MVLQLHAVGHGAEHVGLGAGVHHPEGCTVPYVSDHIALKIKSNISAVHILH